MVKRKKDNELTSIVDRTPLGKKVVKKKENIHHINILKTAANEQIDTFEMNSSQNVLTLLYH